MQDERTRRSLTDDALVARFHRVLVEEIRRTRPQYLEASFTVSEIYQNLVPYRTHRDAIGVEMNGDYEYTLLRLLGGAGDYLVLDSAPAREEITKELGARNPDTTLYREFAAVGVRLNPSRLHDADGPPPSAPVAPGAPETDARDSGAPPPVPGPDAVPPRADEPALFSFDEEGAPLPAAVVADGTPAASAARTGGCPSCGSGLPDRPSLRFCPHCGSDVLVVPCPRCGEAVEPEWRFCIGCGTEVTR